ncbi:acyltransferase [Mesorhizobium loti]|uniref:Acyltransferase n=1 Tax=Mesorhizobium jarvisii TaxID=1777867 RepID=A0A6M7TMI2_9HYPH|nr:MULTISPECIES: acyltransferase [Mesorhizobium]OBQ68416.1 exopolysaccharide production protein exoz [Mesorhizobium loti]QKC65163.1 acyltransferase [Mesorhizobium jarvisii]QKD11078.1 acyltransferase [Mesorhizobium loti]RJT31116.1 acyltransferase [Mesorhizobium jarvisii]
MFYKNVQGLRAIAALMVVFTHSFYPLVPMRNHWSQYVGAIGPSGVDLFFVISGFVVFLSADRLGRKANVTGRWRALREFVVRRVFRIYPVYLTAFLIASLVLVLMPAAELSPAGMKQQPWWKLALLIAQPNNRILAAWTLQYEMTFYAVCALGILLFPRRIVAIIALWMATVLYIWSAGIYVNSVFTAPIVLEFAFGIIVALLVERKFSEYALSSLVLGFGGLIIGAICYRFHDPKGAWALPVMWRTVCFGLPSGFIVYGLVAVEMRRIWTFSKAWTDLGNASYSLYLWHQLLFAVMAASYVQLGLVGKVSEWVLWLSLFAAIFPVSFISYQWVERWFNEAEWVARLAGATRKKPAATVTDLKAETV